METERWALEGYCLVSWWWWCAQGFSLLCHREAKVATMDGWLYPHPAAPSGACSNDLVLSQILVS